MNNSMNFSMDVDSMFDLSDESMMNLIELDFDLSGTLSGLNELNSPESLVPTSVLIDTNESTEWDFERVMAEQGNRMSPNNFSVDCEALNILQNQNPNQGYVDHDSILNHMLRQTEHSREVHPSSSNAFTEFRWNVLENGTQNFYNQHVSFLFFQFCFVSIITQVIIFFYLIFNSVHKPFYNFCDATK
jgi:hypothetical protein